MLLFETTALRPYVRYPNAWRIIDIYPCMGSAPHRHCQLSPIFLLEFASAKALRINIALRAKHSLNQLFCLQLQSEDSDIFICIDSDILSDVKGEGCFTHGWSSLYNNQIVPLKPGSHAV